MPSRGGGSFGRPAGKSALSALAWRGDPSALPAMRVCLRGDRMWKPASKKARTVVASRRPRVGGWPLIRPGSLLPGYLPDILAISRSGDAHRHVRLWASADVMIPPVTINEKFAPTHFFAPPQLPAAGHETSCQSRRFARNLACVVTSCWLPTPINCYAGA